MRSRNVPAVAAAAVLAMALASPAQAQLPDCADALSYFSPVPNAAPPCVGAFSGNAGGSPADLATVSAQITAAWGGGFTYLGKSDDAGFGPWTSNPTTGTLHLDSPLSGDFALILKSATHYSIYGFANVTLDDIAFSTLGTAVTVQTRRGVTTISPKDLSHASLWQRPTVSVPEPGSALLLLTGLVGLAAARRRREGLNA